MDLGVNNSIAIDVVVAKRSAEILQNAHGGLGKPWP